jgi:NADPH:quinone reductase-like Zn-dependent oxidoreductase
LFCTNALGGVGRSAVFAAAEAGANVVVVDNKSAVENLPMVDAVADTLGGDSAIQLIRKVKRGGKFGCFPGIYELLKNYPHIEVNSIFGQIDAGATRRYAEAVRDGRLKIPVARILPLEDAATAQKIAEKGGTGGKLS